MDRSAVHRHPKVAWLDARRRATEAVWDATFPFSDPVFGNSSGFVNAYTSAFGLPPDNGNVASAAGVIILYQAILVAGSFEAAAVRQALLTSQFTNLYGTGLAFVNNKINRVNDCWQLLNSSAYLAVGPPGGLDVHTNLTYPYKPTYPPGFLPQSPSLAYQYWALSVALSRGRAYRRGCCGSLLSSGSTTPF